MRLGKDSTLAARIVTTAGILMGMALIGHAQQAQGGERKFLVFLANAPKSFPDSSGVPVDGLPSRTSIHEQYFDLLRGDIGSFAEYWEEISYRDVTISGITTDWISLPWPVAPQAVDGTVRSPADFTDLDGSGLYGYGRGERFNNVYAASIIDLDGDPGGGDNGPFFPPAGSGSQDTVRDTFLPVWRPGERFIDMDDDGRWDGLDEAKNWMDHNVDGRPDLSGPWVDLNGDGLAENSSNDCVYLKDSDNDGNPDCCPNGPLFGPCDCGGVTWDSPDGTFTDCNGNLVPDECDVLVDDTGERCAGVGCLVTPACFATGWTLQDSGCTACGQSGDELPFDENDDSCDLVGADGIPDECQFVEADTNQSATPSCKQPGSAGNACATKTDCTPVVVTALARCEFDDWDESGALNIVEPFENFMRRWDPCMTDPDATLPNTREAHWVKVYDPQSSGVAVCAGTFQTVAYSGSTQYPLSGPSGQPSYIERNYPGDWRALETAAQRRQLWGPHDPNNLLEEGSCFCSFECTTNADCPWSGGTCDTGVGFCECVASRQAVDETGSPIGISISNACPAGFHATFDPPDQWQNVVGTADPIVRATKMKTAPGSANASPAYMGEFSTPMPSWFANAWEDRYPGGPTHPLSAHPSVGEAFSGCHIDSGSSLQNCSPPAWNSRTLQTSTFDDVDPEVFDTDVNFYRRYFNANAGGLNGDGTGWDNDQCGALGTIMRFESGAFSGNAISFVQECNAAILPEEINGADAAGIFYDGWVEHDDLPSSKYHQAGDERLGEITSPFNTSIFGEDLGRPDLAPIPDGRIPAAGPYATRIDGNFGRDAGNLLLMEMLTWRTKAPYNNATAWESQHGSHPYAGPSGGNLGFRDFNLDGLIDQGEVRPEASAVYNTPSYPFNRRRLVEDCVEALDQSVDFDDFVDTDAMFAARGCNAGGFVKTTPKQYWGTYGPVPFPASITSSGVASGIVLMPATLGIGSDLFASRPRYFPIHTEDGLSQSVDPSTLLPGSGSSNPASLSWNLFFHDLVKSMDDGAQTAYAARQYLRTWEDFGDLFDYEVAGSDGVQVNCPIATWDIMASGRLVHPVGPLKAQPCTEWISPVDLATILTPGVPTSITLPPAEFVRDDSYYFLENDQNPGERIYLWSAGSGFDTVGHAGGGLFKGEGVLILHVELGNEPDSSPPQQTLPPFTYRIVQADGLHQLDDGYTKPSDTTCAAISDAGDPWPGSSENTVFDCDTNPASVWNQGNQCTGLSMSDVRLDEVGGAVVTLTWQPTSIPSLEFVDPPGGVSVNDAYSIKFLANDVHGGTTIELYYTTDENSLVLGASHRIGTVDKNIPGRIELSAAWDISDVADGRYFLFAKLVPGTGADGSEQYRTNPRAGRNNAGTGVLLVPNGNSGVNISGDKARLETWTLRLVDVDPDGVQDWVVNSTLSQPVREAPDDDLYPHLTVDTDGVGAYDVDQVTFWLYNKSCSDNGDPCIVAGDCVAGATCDKGPAFEIGDTWSFTTTGITALSRPVTVEGGEINEGPKAVISATPVSGDPPLTVTFDGIASTEPNGASLTYVWDFGDGPPESGPFRVHVFNDAKTYTVVLRVTSTLSGLFDETTVDIEVTNNTPKATMIALPLRGRSPLDVSFDGSTSTDTETDANTLIYQWNFGDGSTANDAGIPGFLAFTSHLYTSDASDNCDGHAGIACYFATLTITDEGGKQDVATVEITVGNTRPIVSISHSAAAGSAPWEVVFNASGSSDPDGDELRVDWFWGDGSSDLDLPLTGIGGATDGSVPHTFTTTGQYFVTAKVSDDRGGVTEWPGVTITVSEAAVGASDPRAIFTVDPTNPEVDEEITVDASLSFDRPVGSPSAGIASYAWNWGDGSDAGSGKIATHTYTTKGTYTITLTLADEADPPNTSATSKTVIVVGIGESVDDEEEDNERPIAAFTANPTVGQAGVTEFSFDAAASVDPDGDTLTYSWNFRDGSRTETGQTTTHVFDRTGTFNVILTVRDPSNAVAVATVDVTVTTDVPNAAPFAIIATGPRAGSAPFAVQLDGSLSYDPDGDRLTYAWSQNGIVQSDKTDAKATFIFETAGDYEIVLTVNDGKFDGETSSQPVTIHVNGQGGGDSDAGQTVPDDGDPDATTGGATGSPFSFCAPGMLTSLFGALLGLSAMRLTRRRRH